MAAGSEPRRRDRPPAAGAVPQAAGGAARRWTSNAADRGRAAPAGTRPRATSRSRCTSLRGASLPAVPGDGVQAAPGGASTCSSTRRRPLRPPARAARMRVMTSRPDAAHIAIEISDSGVGGERSGPGTDLRAFRHQQAAGAGDGARHQPLDRRGARRPHLGDAKPAARAYAARRTSGRDYNQSGAGSPFSFRNRGLNSFVW